MKIAALVVMGLAAAGVAGYERLNCPRSVADIQSTRGEDLILRDYEIARLVACPGCGASLDALADRLRDEIDLVAGDDIYGAIGVTHRDRALGTIDSIRLHAALDHGDLGEVERRLAVARADEARFAPVIEHAQAVLSPNREPRVLSREELLAIDAVVHGRDPAPASIEAPPHDLTVYYSFCGTRRVEYEYGVRRHASVVDALLSAERPLEALSRHVDEEWTRSLELDAPPPRMQEIGERVFGTEGYRREVERAIAGILLDQRADGRYATIPLFGATRPLPVAYNAFDGVGNHRFETVADIQDFARALLLPVARADRH